MVCPVCNTLMLQTDLFCPRCGTAIQRERSATIDYGRLGPAPKGAVPVPTDQGGMWDPQEITDAELQRREFIARRPPRRPPPKQGGVKFANVEQTFAVDGGPAAAAARKGQYLSYCPKCDCEEPLQRVGKKLYCPGCRRLF